LKYKDETLLSVFIYSLYLSVQFFFQTIVHFFIYTIVDKYGFYCGFMRHKFSIVISK